MAWRISYYNERVKSTIDVLPTGVRADFARLLQLLEEFGADLRLPYSRAMGSGLFELRPRGREGIARVFYCMQMGQSMSSCIASSKKRRKPREMSWILQRDA